MSLVKTVNTSKDKNNQQQNINYEKPEEVCINENFENNNNRYLSDAKLIKKCFNNVEKYRDKLVGTLNEDIFLDNSDHQIISKDIFLSEIYSTLNEIAKTMGVNASGNVYTTLLDYILFDNDNGTNEVLKQIFLKRKENAQLFLKDVPQLETEVKKIEEYKNKLKNTSQEDSKTEPDIKTIRKDIKKIRDMMSLVEKINFSSDNIIKKEGKWKNVIVNEVVGAHYKNYTKRSLPSCWKYFYYMITGDEKFLRKTIEEITITPIKEKPSEPETPEILMPKDIEYDIILERIPLVIDVPKEPVPHNFKTPDKIEFKEPPEIFDKQNPTTYKKAIFEKNIVSRTTTRGFEQLIASMVLNNNANLKTLENCLKKYCTETQQLQENYFEVDGVKIYITTKFIDSPYEVIGSKKKVNNGKIYYPVMYYKLPKDCSEELKERLKNIQNVFKSNFEQQINNRYTKLRNNDNSAIINIKQNIKNQISKKREKKLSQSDKDETLLMKINYGKMPDVINIPKSNTYRTVKKDYQTRVQVNDSTKTISMDSLFNTGLKITNYEQQQNTGLNGELAFYKNISEIVGIVDKTVVNEEVKQKIKEVQNNKKNNIAIVYEKDNEAKNDNKILELIEYYEDKKTPNFVHHYEYVQDPIDSNKTIQQEVQTDFFDKDGKLKSVKIHGKDGEKNKIIDIDSSFEYKEGEEAKIGTKETVYELSGEFKDKKPEKKEIQTIIKRENGEVKTIETINEKEEKQTDSYDSDGNFQSSNLKKEGYELFIANGEKYIKRSDNQNEYWKFNDKKHVEYYKNDKKTQDITLNNNEVSEVKEYRGNGDFITLSIEKQADGQGNKTIETIRDKDNKKIQVKITRKNDPCEIEYYDDKERLTQIENKDKKEIIDYNNNKRIVEITKDGQTAQYIYDLSDTKHEKPLQSFVYKKEGDVLTIDKYTNYDYKNNSKIIVKKLVDNSTVIEKGNRKITKYPGIEYKVEDIEKNTLLEEYRKENGVYCLYYKDDKGELIKQYPKNAETIFENKDGIIQKYVCNKNDGTLNMIEIHNGNDVIQITYQNNIKDTVSLYNGKKLKQKNICKNNNIDKILLYNEELGDLEREFTYKNGKIKTVYFAKLKIEIEYDDSEDDNKISKIINKNTNEVINYSDIQNNQNMKQQKQQNIKKEITSETTIAKESKGREIVTVGGTGKLSLVDLPKEVQEYITKHEIDNSFTIGGTSYTSNDSQMYDNLSVNSFSFDSSSDYSVQTRKQTEENIVKVFRTPQEQQKQQVTQNAGNELGKVLSDKGIALNNANNPQEQKPERRMRGVKPIIKNNNQGRQGVGPGNP